MDLQLSLNTKTKLGCGYTGDTEFMVIHFIKYNTIYIMNPIWLHFQLGTIESEKSKDFQLTVCPVKLGLITIYKLQLIDVFLKRTYEFDNFVQVFVVDQDYRDDEFFEMDKYVQYGMEKMTLSSELILQ